MSDKVGLVRGHHAARDRLTHHTPHPYGPSAAFAEHRFRLIDARLLIAEGRPEQARAVFDAGFEVADLREGAEILGEVWSQLTDEPLPDAYDYRMRPRTP
ncbi:hypothetical protein QFZ67_001439 [Streptomyces sp. V1I1]|nr:hypothetical protein [Streptomyces sp. V1I1]